MKRMLAIVPLCILIMKTAAATMNAVKRSVRFQTFFIRSCTGFLADKIQYLLLGSV